jgi:hypothetical protein
MIFSKTIQGLRHYRIGVPRKVTARRTENFDESIASQSNGELLAWRFYSLEAGFVDNFAQLGFGQLLIVVSHDGLALV